MSILKRFRSIYSLPSIRRDADYSEEVGHDARMAVCLVYLDFYYTEGPYRPHQKKKWMDGVAADLKHIHHTLLPFLGRDYQLPDLCDFLLQAASTEALLDFLELSLKSAMGFWTIFPDRSGNEFVGTLNLVLGQFSSPYLLTPFAYDKCSSRGTADRWVVTAYPKAYLRQSGVVEQEVIFPALTLLSDPAYATANDDFRKALERQRSGDFDGVATSCVATLEAVIKVTASKRGFELRRRSALKALAQSFFAKARISSGFQKPIDFLADSRNEEGDAHGHESKPSITRSHAAFLIGLTASFVPLLTDEQ